MSPVEALRQIRALCDEADGDAQKWLVLHSEDEGVLHPTLDTSDVRAVLDAVSADATPTHGVDRGALRSILEDFASARGGESEPQSYGDAIAAILALVRPAESAILEPGPDGLVHVEDGWRIRRTYTVGQPGETIERLA